ncbi:hypothetical protein BDV32DRAFT_131688 [Aspergillus pseudonomiae]|uniref:Uncharacterized protein n=1 Tax=Aspergillus pseudonomiae TaxID=1506151 RepID=A0A5N6HM60_9EURO|nr:uncharacterized protein BDV37DRAFT_264084 [Aspergillus pseudonomiae]KAB8254859.1 hypothetical protein BDV32DRAFT_131688 [Aspergillus pseudonomiae]KAE8398185.1 hypothetical protein BDV37DRAFT_264084 [Aspergillus pseudonomiae]
MLSAEAIIALVTLLVTCPPSILVVWKCFRGPQFTFTDIELGVRPTLPTLSPHYQYNTIILQFPSTTPMVSSRHIYHYSSALG